MEVMIFWLEVRTFWYCLDFGIYTKKWTISSLYKCTKTKEKHIYLANRGGHPLKDLHLLSVRQTRVHGQNSQVFLHAVS